MATRETEIRRVMTYSQSRQTVQESLSRKNSSQKRAGGVDQGVGLEFKPHTTKKKEH
jgi:hypothetical protein